MKKFATTLKVIELKIKLATELKKVIEKEKADHDKIAKS